MLGGLPLLVWSIKTAIVSGLFRRIIVSTDSDEYASIGKKYGAEVPWLRRKHLSEDDTPTAQVIKDVIERYETAGETFDTITLLQPTSPLRSADDILQAHKLLTEKKGNSVIGVTTCDHPPLWCNTLPGDHSLENFIPPEAMVPRQKLPIFYRINGAVYVANVEAFKKHGTFLCPGSYALIMPAERSVDIDNETDMLLAETITGQDNYIKPWIR